MLPMSEFSAANGTDAPPKSGAGQGRLAASSPAGRTGDDQGSHSPPRGPQSPEGGRTARDHGREGRAGGRGGRGQGGWHGRGRSGSPFAWQPPPGMEDGLGRGRGRGTGRSRGRGARQDRSQGTHLWGGAFGDQRAQSCREVAQSPRVRCQILRNNTRFFDSSQALDLEQLLGRSTSFCKSARDTVQQPLDPVDNASSQVKVS